MRSSPTTHHVFLIPGFFGFVNFGRLVYFSHVREVLEDALAKQRLRVEIHRVRLGPTSSLRVRTAELHRMIHETAPEGAPIHLVGHSTGGIDARLLATPGSGDLEDCARRVKSVTCIAAPHRGTPLAGFFETFLGGQALKFLSLATIILLREGRIPAGWLVRGTAALARIALDKTSPPLELLDQLEGELLGTLEKDQQDLIGGFVRDVNEDQALIPELAPDAMAMLDAATPDRPGVRYGSVTATATPPSLRERLKLGPHPWAQGTYSLYAWLHRRVGTGDGIVPLASQRRGQILFEANGDHLDVIGHFHGRKLVPPHVDWLNTGSHFDITHFEALWQRVAQFIAAR